MNWDQFKDSAFYMFLAGTVVATWSIRQEVAGSSPFTVTNIYFHGIQVNSVKTFSKNSIIH